MEKLRTLTNPSDQALANAERDWLERTWHTCDPNLGRKAEDCPGCLANKRAHDPGDEDPMEWENYFKFVNTPIRIVDGRLVKR